MLITTLDNSGPQQAAIYDSATGTWVSNNAVSENLGPSAAISADGSTFVTGSGLVDANTDLLGYLVWQDVFQSFSAFSAPLEKIQDGGSLVYVPFSNFTDPFGMAHASYVDIFDVNHGSHLRRISLNEQIQQVTDAMTIDPFGQNIYLITDAGLTAVQLGNAPLSIGHLTPSSGPPGTNVTIHGSGFQQTTSVNVNGSPATATFTDANTLDVIMPNGSPGAVQITVANQAGRLTPWTQLSWSSRYRSSESG